MVATKDNNYQRYLANVKCFSGLNAIITKTILSYPSKTKAPMNGALVFAILFD
jgi:hypothetical protein